MEFRKNIIVSAVLHGMFFVAALLLASGSFLSGIRVASPLNVSFFEEITEKAGPRESGELKKRAVSYTAPSPVLKKKMKKSNAAGDSEPEQKKLSDRSIPETPGTEPHLNDERFEKTAQDIIPAAASGAAQSGGHESLRNLPRTAAVVLSSSAGKSPVHGGAAGIPDIAALIRSALERAKNYPPMAKKRGIQGTVTASFVINAKGFPEEIRILESSGYEVLDTAARATVQKAAPFPVVQGIIEVPITFTLQ